MLVLLFLVEVLLLLLLLLLLLPISRQYVILVELLNLILPRKTHIPPRSTTVIAVTSSMH